jgi:hypothetical protein
MGIIEARQESKWIIEQEQSVLSWCYRSMAQRISGSFRGLVSESVLEDFGGPGILARPLRLQLQ